MGDSPLLEILAYEETPLGILCLRRRRILGGGSASHVTEITLNHEFLMSSHHTASERALAELALEMVAGEELRVLVGGLGLGYTAREVLRSERVADVEVIEFLPPVIQWLEDGLTPLAEELRADSRLRVRRGDVYARLAETPTDTCDAILIDVDHSPDDRLDSGPGFFYTREGLLRAREHLAPGGVLAVWSYEESSPFADALREVFDEVRLEKIEFENELIDEQATDLLFLAR